MWWPGLFSETSETEMGCQLQLLSQQVWLPCDTDLPKLLTDRGSRSSGIALRTWTTHLFSLKTDDSEGGEEEAVTSISWGSPCLWIWASTGLPTLFGCKPAGHCVSFLLSPLTASLCDNWESQQWSVKIKHRPRFKWEFQIVVVFLKVLNSLNIQKKKYLPWKGS